MIAGRYITRITAVLMAAAVILCFVAMGFSKQIAEAAGGTGVAMEYERELFDTGEPITVNILMDQGDWEGMLQNAAREEYVQCNVEINGRTFYRVGIRPKGNTSLTSIAADPDTDRFSFKLEFDQYVDGQTCFGLDKLILNNNYADATNMKEALVYDMYRFLGVDASLYNYAKVHLNGEYWGVYLALEAVEDSFLIRNYGVKSGELYKPESMGMGGGGRGFSGERMDNNDLFQMFQEFRSEEDAPAKSEGGTDPARSEDGGGRTGPPAGGGAPGKGGFGGFSMGGGGANLNYSGDDLDSYSTIWEGEVGSTSKSDHKRVVEALKNISEGTELERYMDTDNLLKYAAVHMLCVNEDSLSGMMAHNYYLYERDGQLNLLPWDYNLALGGMGGSDATGMVNDPIDDIFEGTDFFDKLMENEEYLSLYHDYLSRLAQEYIAGGGFDEFYERTRGQIDSLVETDPTAFYTYEEYLKAADILYEAVKLRGKSVAGQVDGTIPSTGQAQRQDSSALIDASTLDLSAMGSMSMGGGPLSAKSMAAPGNGAWPKGGNGVPGGDMPEGFDPSQLGGEMPEGFDPSQFGGTAGDQAPAGGGESPADADSRQEAESGGQARPGQRPNGSFDPSQMGGFEEGGDTGAGDGVKILAAYGIYIAILIGAIIFAALFKRRSIRR